MCDVKMSNFEVATDMSGLLSLSCVEKKGGAILYKNTYDCRKRTLKKGASIK